MRLLMDDGLIGVAEQARAQEVAGAARRTGRQVAQYASGPNVTVGQVGLTGRATSPARFKTSTVPWPAAVLEIRAAGLARPCLEAPRTPAAPVPAAPRPSSEPYLQPWTALTRTTARARPVRRQAT